LLLLTRAWAEKNGSHLEAFHLNHRLRGQDADLDEQFCEQLCRKYEIRLHVQREDPRPLSRRRGLGLEEAGRVLRYRHLNHILDEASELDLAATGHHQDDQIETVTMRVFRGTGLDGLRGIRPRSGRLIRPLLSVTRQELVSFLTAEGQAYRLDGTNLTGEATRNRVRRELLPLARDIFGEGSGQGLAHLADLAETDLELLDRLARTAWTELAGQAADAEVPPPANDPRLPVAGILALEPALVRRVMRLAIASQRGTLVDLERQHVDGLLQWLPDSRSGATWELPGGWRAVREFDRLRILPPVDDYPPLSSGQSYRILVTDSRHDSGNGTVPPAEGCTGSASTLTSTAVRRSGWQLDCPTDVLQGNLALRPWRAGDRIDLLGLGGHKKVSDLLRERRIGVSDRPGILVVEDDAGILWVVGLARAERTRLLPSTSHKVTIAVVPEEDELTY
jgi:tRNA(Ile)-lysidine synthase